MTTLTVIDFCFFCLNRISCITVVPITSFPVTESITESIFLPHGHMFTLAFTRTPGWFCRAPFYQVSPLIVNMGAWGCSSHHQHTCEGRVCSLIQVTNEDVKQYWLKCQPLLTSHYTLCCCNPLSPAAQPVSSPTPRGSSFLL